MACEEEPLPDLGGLAWVELPRFWLLPLVVAEDREPVAADLEVPPLRLAVGVVVRFWVLVAGLLTVEEERELLLLPDTMPLERELLELPPERETPPLRLPLWLLLDGREAEEEDRVADEEDEDLDVED